MRIICHRSVKLGKLTQTAYIERFNQTARHEWLDMHLFDSIAHAQLLTTQWLGQYNSEASTRPLAENRQHSC